MIQFLYMIIFRKLKYLLIIPVFIAGSVSANSVVDYANQFNPNPPTQTAYTDFYNSPSGSKYDQMRWTFDFGTPNSNIYHYGDLIGPSNDFGDLTAFINNGGLNAFHIDTEVIVNSTTSPNTCGLQVSYPSNTSITKQSQANFTVGINLNSCRDSSTNNIWINDDYTQYDYNFTIRLNIREWVEGTWSPQFTDVIHQVDFVFDYNSTDGLSYSQVASEPPLQILYPELNSSVYTPTQLSVIYDNNGNYDQLGIDLYYNNDQDQLVNEFVWYSIPVETQDDIVKNFPLNVQPDKTYQMIVSLNDQDGTDYYETDFHPFDTFNLIAPDPYEDLVCDSALDLYCWGKRLLLWAFVPTTETIQQFQDITVMDKVPFVYFDIAKEFFIELVSPVEGDSMPGIGVDLLGGRIEFFNQETFDNFPQRDTLRYILLIGLYLTFTTYLYRRVFTFTNTDNVKA